MQQAGVIAVLHVFDIELPVTWNDLAVAADELCRRPHDATDVGHVIRPQIRFERRGVAAQRAEYQSGETLDAQLTRRILLGPAIGRHAALAGNAATERDAGELAGEVVGPIVVDADDLAR